jgi:hypothetical protein
MSWMNHNIAPGHKLYVPRNKEKFIGTHVVCRSSWEQKFAKWCDTNPDVVLWSSESIAIQYIDPKQKKSRRYYPDFIIRTKKDETFVIEIKPLKETVAPRRGKKKVSLYLKEEATYLTNMAKWHAAHVYCQKNGYQFKIVTENSLGL